MCTYYFFPIGISNIIYPLSSNIHLIKKFKCFLDDRLHHATDFFALMQESRLYTHQNRAFIFYYNIIHYTKCDGIIVTVGLFSLESKQSTVTVIHKICMKESFPFLCVCMLVSACLCLHNMCFLINDVIVSLCTVGF